LEKIGPLGFAPGPWLHGHVEFYGPRNDAESIATIHRSIELGINFLDTADVYGYGDNEILVGQPLAIAVKRYFSPRSTHRARPLQPARARRERQAGIRARLLRGQPEAARRCSDRSVLPAPRRFP